MTKPFAYISKDGTKIGYKNGQYIAPSIYNTIAEEQGENFVVDPPSGALRHPKSSPYAWAIFAQQMLWEDGAPATLKGTEPKPPADLQNEIDKFNKFNAKVQRS